MDCPNPNCKLTIPPAARSCPACQEDVGFPNVRAAQIFDEQRALDARFADAEVSTKARKVDTILHIFGTVVLNSRAVIARNISVVDRLISSENSLYTTYYKQVRSGSRIPEENTWDRGRTSIDAALFPNYHEEIVFAALSLNGRGMSCYGDYTIVLKNELIENRATVFEENPFIFFDTHRVVTGSSIPLGFRAVWAERDKLAKAKLHSKLDIYTSEKDFPGLLLNDNGEKSDFIEVHIYGQIHRRAIECVKGPRPKKKADLAIWQSLKKRLNDANIALEEI